MRTEDLIPTFIETLAYYGAALPNDMVCGEHLEYTSLPSYANVAIIDEDNDYWQSDDVGYDLEALFDALNEIAPPFCYFGATEGDGSDYGFWVSWDSIEEERSHACKHGDYEFLDDGRIIQVSDHGNVTLLDASFNEIWAVV